MDMPNVAKRINKTGKLEPGETAIAGCFLGPIGSVRAAASFGAVGAVRSESQAKIRQANRTLAETQTLVAAMPETVGLIAVTDRRLVVFGADRWINGAQDLEASYAFDQIRDFAADHSWMHSQMRLTFVDGSFRDFESVRSAKPKAFAAALEQALLLHR